jgi:hypothetical protein
MESRERQELSSGKLQTLPQFILFVVSSDL